MGCAYSTHREDEKSVGNFSQNTSTEEREIISVDSRIILIEIASKNVNCIQLAQDTVQ
jgi:hypothetical protein